MNISESEMVCSAYVKGLTPVKPDSGRGGLPENHGKHQR